MSRTYVIRAVHPSMTFVTRRSRKSPAPPQVRRVTHTRRPRRVRLWRRRCCGAPLSSSHAHP
eukprot:4033927-Prymnesium_polylepis.1